MKNLKLQAALLERVAEQLAVDTPKQPANASDCLYGLIADYAQLPHMSIPVAVKLARVAEVLDAYRQVMAVFIGDPGVNRALAELAPLQFDLILEDARHG